MSEWLILRHKELVFTSDFTKRHDLSYASEMANGELFRLIEFIQKRLQGSFNQKIQNLWLI
jgi:hypothetical protein